MIVPLELEAQLTLSTAEGEVMLQAEGDHITLDIQDLRTATGLVQTWHGRQPWRVMLEQTRPWLLASGLTVDLRLCGHTVARFGARALPNFLARALRLGPVELKPFAMLWAWWRSRRSKLQ